MELRKCLICDKIPIRQFLKISEDFSVYHIACNNCPIMTKPFPTIEEAEKNWNNGPYIIEGLFKGINVKAK